MPKLDLRLHCPLIIIPNLSSSEERFELDFGTIAIQSKMIYENERWLNHPEKPFRCLGINVHNRDLRLEFKNDDQSKVYDPIIEEDTIAVDVVVPNDSPYFVDCDEDGVPLSTPLRIDHLGHTFDMDQVETAVKVQIKQTLLRLQLRQDVLMELFKTLEHNILKKDAYSKAFNAALKKRSATLVEEG